MHNNQKNTLKRVLKYIKRYKLMVVFSFVFALISVIFTLYAPILVGDAIDLIIGSSNVNFDAIKHIIFKLFVVIGINVLAQWFMSIINNKITYVVVRDIRIECFNHIEKLPLSYFDNHNQGDVVSRIVADIDSLADGLLMGMSQLFTGITTIAGTLMFMVYINFYVAMVVVILTPLSLFVAAYISKKTYTLFRNQSESRGELTSLIDEMVGEQKQVQAFCYEKKALSRFKVINDKLEKDSMKATFYSSLVNPSTRFVNGVVYAAVGVFGAFLTINGRITVGKLTCFLSYANQYTKPFNEISNVITELQNAIACAERVFELLDEQKEVNPKDTFEDVLQHDIQGKIEINNVNFSYTKDKKLIQNLNLLVNPGMRVAIVGPTGCGKSTIINLLMRFYDVDSGKICIDDVDINNISRESLHEKYGMVLQETWLKTGTIKENISYGKPDATDDEIIEAAKKAHAHSFIKRLPNGYDTFVTEDGGNLSQGQKQLLCIARVMLLMPPMLILDEATSSIDTRTEIRIQKAFSNMMKDRTSFIVAHRLSTIKEADIILVMKDGNIIEKGNHKELMELGGFYNELYNSQYVVS